MKKVTLFSSFLLLFSLNLIGRYPTDAQNNRLNARTPFDVGVVLDMESPLGKMSNICISMALEDFYTTHNNYTTELILHWRDSKQDIVDAASMGNIT
ncbi:Ionotropic glutamate receptor [Cinnamomum micranthum f. kanehirae]|uniref:Ionotropic glutamate receptor n=1 Tax=Cinnamomum micranthum f. kanehirae TaxID=337451 RepID=A0A3S3MKG8_9MAGN|nr:Ionotropic glutamate receptor [Cinnamomum micranthum f. kanehirae]